MGLYWALPSVCLLSTNVTQYLTPRPSTSIFRSQFVVYKFLSATCTNLNLSPLFLFLHATNKSDESTLAFTAQHLKETFYNVTSVDPPYIMVFVEFFGEKLAMDKYVVVIVIPTHLH